MQVVPISRKFQPVPEFQQTEDGTLDDVFPALGHGESKVWSDLLGEYRVVILADAGAGKTYELRAAAEQQKNEGKASFFIRIENIDQNFTDAFEIGTAEEFGEWINGDDEAWFFLDSVDEIRLSEPRAFEDAIRAFSSRLRTAYQRAHVYLSSRPYAWRPTLDRALVEEVLPFDPAARIAVDSDDILASDDGAVTVSRQIEEVDDELKQPLRLYLLSQLEDDEIRHFAEHANVPDFVRFFDALVRSGMLPFARLPFDLHDLIQRWRINPVFPNRLEMLRQGVLTHLSETRSLSPMSIDRHLDGARFLAITSILTGRSNIRFPNSTGSNGIDAQALLSTWTPAEIGALLATGVFGEPLFGEVRFRHREIRELLAAEWWASQLSVGGTRSQLDPLMFKTQYGQSLLVGRLRPIVPWLVLFDEATRTRVLEHYPEVITEGGDVASLPLEIRREMLRRLIEQVVDPTSAVRGLDNAALLRVAQRDLENEANALLQRYYKNDEAIFVLARVVWQGRMLRCVDTLAEIASDASRDIYSRIVSTRAVSAVGIRQQAIGLWTSLNTGSEQIPRRVFAELIDYSDSDPESIELLLGSIGRLEPYQKYEATGLSEALGRLIDRVSNSSNEPSQALEELATGFRGFLDRAPYIEGCRVSAPFQWLLEPALQCVEHLVAVRSASALSPAALWILDAVPQARYWRSNDFHDRKSAVGVLVPAWPELNDALYWSTIESYRRQHPDEEVTNDWTVGWVGHFWNFKEDSFERVLAWVSSRELRSDKLLALSRAVRLYFEYRKQRTWLSRLRQVTAGDSDLASVLNHLLNPPINAERKKYEVSERRRRSVREKRAADEATARAEFAARLAADPDQIRNPPGLEPGQFSTYQYHLLRIAEGENEVGTSRVRGANWRSLIPEFGLAVAETYRDTAVAFWRDYKPKLRSEGADTSSVPYALTFAMAGLEIEFSAPDISSLSAFDVQRALRYTTWELNGFPRWLGKFFDAYPMESETFFWNEIVWELNQPAPSEPMRYMLSDLVYHAPWLHARFGKILYDWLLQNDAPNASSLRYCRTIMVNGGVSANDLADLARAKISNSVLSDELLAIWSALGVDTNPAISWTALQTSLAARPEERRSSLGQLFYVSLMGGRTEVSSQIGKFKTPTYLGQLYLTAHAVIPVSQDIDRAGAGVYSPTLRDDAQDARERLIGLLGEIKGELTYRTFLDLAAQHPVAEYRDYMRVRAYKCAVADGDISAWPLAEVVLFAKRLGRRRVSSVQSKGKNHAAP
ncbi:hypothetical protein ACC757_24300 [Rhizobium ruizarguesonis]